MAIITSIRSIPILPEIPSHTEKQAEIDPTQGIIARIPKIGENPPTKEGLLVEDITKNSRAADNGVGKLFYV